ncbi:MAG: TAXI family TRAP transporter solute-binding subunit, partial [Alphaproteobacteria bacterium]|nr:TAXI family TRAP transporter solute-binding subunit [Alphaproteobacteria bacterium]
QYHAYKGTALFERLGADKSMRSVFSLHSEPFTVVARRDSGIKSFNDLKGKRVNIGNPGSGMRATMEVLMQQKGWKMDDFKRVFEMKASEQGQALCDNNIDAMVYAAGHPNGAIQEVTSTCEAMLIPVEGEAVDSLVEEYPFYTYATIPGGMYVGNPEDVKTFGVKATFVSSEKVSEEMIYQVVKAVFDNFDAFKTLHPVFSTLDPALMVTDGNTAPLHKGAERYFREKGLLK